jgi:hypothetical protein
MVIIQKIINQIWLILLDIKVEKIKLKFLATY